MSNILNLSTEIGANIIGDDPQPVLELFNTSTGPGLLSRGLVVVSGASVDTLTARLGTMQGTTTVGVPLTVTRGLVVSSPTVALLALNIGSGASAPVFELQAQGFVSATTIQFTTGATSGSGALRIKYADNYGWIPILPDASVTGSAR